MIHIPRVFITSSLFIKDRRTQTTRSLLHSNFGTAHCSRRPIEREENKSGKIFSISKEKALGNLIQTDGASRRTRSFGKKSSRYGFVVRAIFSSKQGKVSHWLVFRSFRQRDPSREKDAWRRTHCDIDNASKSSLHSGSRLCFIVCYLRIFGDLSLSTYTSRIETFSIDFRCDFIRSMSVMGERREREKTRRIEKNRQKNLAIDRIGNRIDSSNC